MIEEIADFLHSFKNKIVESDELVLNYKEKIKEYSNQLKKEGLNKEFEENFLTILGYTYRLDDLKQRLFFTFQEAVYAVDLDKLMKNNDSLKLNCIVYILVLDTIIDEYTNKVLDEGLKTKALQVYGKIQEAKSKEDKKYHMYQY